MQRRKVAGNQVPRQQPAAVVRLSVGSCYHSRAAWGWDGEPSDADALRLVVKGGGFRRCQWRSRIMDHHGDSTSCKAQLGNGPPV